ncbi:MAG: hypothetical protein E6230_00595 [Paenibacillus dendritiformis]|uniref:hypothetical protein n=1 Tax=Paenibacillus dendritiformis TaxID=130049 RepID=UPI00143CE7CE|nr:hypothetical protein [Paenibacillus dendritiformis]MDU5140666.1 hypothetical protein [Paenibacillus dendritiformis]NKI21183.1 hypothetical protein [Paenibacillus dendritiformis]NRF97761.1 hypothetical protein [Paenibacillus dendritiformis]GIO70976.1 hypothetical protein J27TS7_04900 [Paenibacillus dendritiformis]
MRKWIIVMMAFLLVFAVTTPSLVDAKRGGSFRSGVKKYQPAPKKAETNNQVNRSDSTGNTKTTGTNTTANRGFFSGGSFMKGLMIGGLAGMLFGGLFGNMGFFGEILGLLVNLMALFALFMLVVMVFRKFKDRRKPPRPESGRWD